MRRIFARFGKIVSFKLIKSARFPTNIAYVAYKYPQQAANALAKAGSEPEFVGSELTINWHKKRNVPIEETAAKTEEVDVAAVLRELDLLKG